MNKNISTIDSATMTVQKYRFRYTFNKLAFVSIESIH